MQGSKMGIYKPLDDVPFINSLCTVWGMGVPYNIKMIKDVIKCAPKEADTKILYLQLQKNSSQARLLWEGFLPQKAVLLWFIHSFTNFSPELYKFLLPLAFILCVFLPKREHKRIWCSQSQTLCDNITAG